MTVIATEPSYAEVVDIPVRAGRFFNNVDMLRSLPHCLLTEALANRLFPAMDPLYKMVLVNGEPLTVIGILDRLPRTLAVGMEAPDHCVLIPLATDRNRFGELNLVVARGSFSMEKVEVSQLVLQMVDEQAVVEGARVVRSLLERYRENADFAIDVPLELLEQKRKQARLWSIVFMAIASVSLVVGGIGIMNTMLASVTERTREIGIRRALGAKKGDIVSQFLVESVTLTTVGGAVGILIGVLVPWAVEAILGFRAVSTASTMLVPFAMAVAVGLISGLYPALRAAQLDPIEALRHE